MRLLCVSTQAPNTPGPNFLHVCLSILCPFCISCCPQLGPVRFSSNRSERNLAPVSLQNFPLLSNSMCTCVHVCKHIDVCLGDEGAESGESQSGNDFNKCLKNISDLKQKQSGSWGHDYMWKTKKYL
jgi:hypothetical protein